jgi:hypothetical protein
MSGLNNLARASPTFQPLKSVMMTVVQREEEEGSGQLSSV